MQITLSAQQSQILETLSQRGNYASLERAIDVALLLLAEEITEQNPEATPEYLDWLEETRLKIDAGVRAVEENDVVEVDAVLAQLRSKVDAAIAKSA